MAKTITAMLFGLAVKDGKIRSLDDRAQDYVPALKGSAYGETSLRALLTMSSGVAFSETYGPDDDLSKFVRGLFGPNATTAAASLRSFNTREAPEGTRFHYASSETEVLGLVLAAATGQRLTDYASERLWKPMGAEADAQWSADRKGDVLGFCCFSARLRDYARLGLLLANDGGDVIPAPWVIEATSAPRGLLARAAQGDAVLGLRLSDVAVPGARPHVRAARHSRSGDLRRSRLEAGAGAHGRAAEGVERSGRPGTDDAVVRAGQGVRREGAVGGLPLPALLEPRGEALVAEAVRRLADRAGDAQPAEQLLLRADRVQPAIARGRERLAGDKARAGVGDAELRRAVTSRSCVRAGRFAGRGRRRAG